MGADNTVPKRCFGKQFVHPARRWCPPTAPPAQCALPPRPRRLRQLGIRRHFRARRHPRGPVRIAQIRRPPIFPGNRPMHLQVFRARTDVKPAVLVSDDAADPPACPDPFGQHRHKRNFLVRRNPLEDLRVPEGNIGKIVCARWPNRLPISMIRPSRRQLSAPARSCAEPASLRCPRENVPSISGSRSISVRISPL